MLGDRTIAENREDSSFIWDNYYYEEEHMNEYELTLFIQEADQKELYHKYQETHFQRAYTLEEIRELLEKSGLRFVAAYEDYTKEAPGKGSERICVVAREQGK